MTNALLLSGGVDSIALLHWMRPDLAITVDYGQLPALGEIAASKAVCEFTGVTHTVIRADCKALGIGTMSGTPPRPGNSFHYPDRPEWWPFRNQLLITIAAALVVPRGIDRLLIGSVRDDECHADGTPEFVAALNNVLKLQEGHLVLEAPAIQLSTIELINKSGVPSTLLAWAHSCHVACTACGECRGCHKQQEVFESIE